MSTDPIPSTSSPTTTTTLESQIEELSQAIKSVQYLRQIPPFLLRTPVTATQHYNSFKSIQERLSSDPVQNALVAARDSELLDKSDITYNARRENRRKRSPQPYIAPAPTTSTTTNPSMFPQPTDSDATPLRMDQLPDFVADFNRTNPCSLRIWLRSRGAPKTDIPVIVRLTIPDVLAAYVTLNCLHLDPTLVVESISVFSPREQITPQSQSEFAIYQTLSQQISKMIQSCPSVPFQKLMSLLCSYRDLFISRCTKCDRVLSTEGHIPPVARVWKDGQPDETQAGQWDPRHVGCQ
ncbi:hypothetical protein ONZ45_g14043 [Pleurotus djamor]|nr:hypothetical protein ONZ45_g14043 [Pleurotus djamor]